MQSGLTVEEFANKLLSRALLEPVLQHNLDKPFPVEGAHLGWTLQDHLSFDRGQSISGLADKHFTDQGAKVYTKAARYEFQKYAAIKGLDHQHALGELREISFKYQGDFDLMEEILMGRHELTGYEMFLAIQKTGNCPMQKTLQEWSEDPLAALCKVFVEAIEV